MYCSYCATASDAVFCPNCGAKMPDIDQPQSHYGYTPPPPAGQPVIHVTTVTAPIAPGHIPSQKNKWVAFLLCFFLGYLGIHRFYVGKIGTGILYLLTGGLLGIGYLVDWIVILCGGFKDSYGYTLMD